jgi:hypothetical protein
MIQATSGGIWHWQHRLNAEAAEPSHRGTSGAHTKARRAVPVLKQGYAHARANTRNGCSCRKAGTAGWGRVSDDTSPGSTLSQSVLACLLAKSQNFKSQNLLNVD